MKDGNEMQAAFDALRAIFKAHEPSLIVMVDEPGKYYLQTTHIMKNKQPLYFGGVQIMKSYVSFHLFPLYACPELVKTISPELKARMQGKACLNFKRVDTALFEELARLTQTGFDRFKSPPPI